MFGFFKKKVNVFVWSVDLREFSKYKGTLSYDRNNKQWYLHFANEKIPFEPSALKCIYHNVIFLEKVGTDEYNILDIEAVLKSIHSIESGVKTVIPIRPSEIYDDFLKEELRKMRLKGFWSKYLPIIGAGILIIIIAVSMFMLLQTVTGGLSEVSRQFAEAMKILQNITMEQTELLKKLSQIPPEFLKK